MIIVPVQLRLNLMYPLLVLTIIHHHIIFFITSYHIRHSVPLSVAPGHFVDFDVSRHLTLVPAFRDNEVDSYFAAFERIAAALHWLREVWSLLIV